jgi:hypothetical protein
MILIISPHIHISPIASGADRIISLSVGAPLRIILIMDGGAGLA